MPVRFLPGPQPTNGKATGVTTSVPISKRLVLINSASAVLTKIINVAVLVWLYQYLLKRIAPEEYALYPVVMSVMAFLPLLTVVLTSGVGRYVVEAYAKGDEEGVTQIVSTMFPLHVLAAAVILAAGGAFAWHIDRILTIAPGRLWDARLMMGLAVFSFAAGLVVAPFGVGLYVRQKFVLANLIGISRELLRIGILFVLLFAVSTRVLWVAVAVTASGLVHLAVTQVISRRLVPALRFRLSAIRWSRARTLTGFGFWNFIASVGDRIRQSADPILLNLLSTPVNVASFHVGATAFTQVHATSMLVTGPIVPALTAMHATNDKERLRRVYLTGGRYALWASLLMVVPLIAFRREIMALYAPAAYADAATVMALLLLIFPLAYGNNMMPKLANATAQVRPLAWRQILTQIVNLGLTIVFLRQFKMGAVGSALATFLVYTVSQPLLMWPLGWRLTGTKPLVWARQTLLLGMAPAVGASVVAIAVRAVYVPRTWLGLGVAAAVVALSYCAVLVSLAMTTYDRSLVRQLVKRLHPRPRAAEVLA